MRKVRKGLYQRNRKIFLSFKEIIQNVLSAEETYAVCLKEDNIAIGSADNLQSLDTIKEFCLKTSATLTVMDGGEHWFHTKEQMEFLDEWIKKVTG